MKITQIEAIPVKVPYHEGITEMMVERNLYQGNTVYKATPTRDSLVSVKPKVSPTRDFSNMSAEIRLNS